MRQQATCATWRMAPPSSFLMRCALCMNSADPTMMDPTGAPSPCADQMECQLDSFRTSSLPPWSQHILCHTHMRKSVRTLERQNVIVSTCAATSLTGTPAAADTAQKVGDLFVVEGMATHGNATGNAVPRTGRRGTPSDWAALNTRAPSICTTSPLAAAQAFREARYLMDSTRPPARLCVCSMVTAFGIAECWSSGRFLCRACSMTLAHVRPASTPAVGQEVLARPFAQGALVYRMASSRAFRCSSPLGSEGMTCITTPPRAEMPPACRWSRMVKGAALPC